jgi:hypothetical protein
MLSFASKCFLSAALKILSEEQSFKFLWLLSHDYLFIISMTKLDTSQCQHHILSPVAKVQSCQTFNQNLVLLFVFSFSSFVKANFGAFVRIFIQFHFTFVFKIPLRHFVCFGKIINCTACSTINEIIVLLSTNQHPVILSC